MEFAGEILDIDMGCLLRLREIRSSGFLLRKNIKDLERALPYMD